MTDDMFDIVLDNMYLSNVITLSKANDLRKTFRRAK